MFSMKKQMMFAAAAVAMVLFISPVSKAQTLNSGPSTVALTANLAESLTLTVTPSSASFNLVPSGVSNINTISVTTTWVLATTHTGLNVYAYFTSANALTDAGGNNIPTTNFLGAIGVGAYSAFSGSPANPWGSTNSKTLFSHGVFGAPATFNSSNTTTLGLEINTTGLTLPASTTYAGTLTIQAQAL